MSEELLPCPFCGGKAHMLHPGAYNHPCLIECEDCGCILESFDEGDLGGKAWNRRAGSAVCGWDNVANACVSAECRCKAVPPRARPQECPASGAGHDDGPHGPSGSIQCAYCGEAPSGAQECPTCRLATLGYHENGCPRQEYEPPNPPAPDYPYPRVLAQALLVEHWLVGDGKVPAPIVREFSRVLREAQASPPGGFGLGKEGKTND